MKKSTPKTSIELDKQQYGTLVRALQIAESVYGIMSDMVDPQYDVPADAIEELSSWVLAKAGEMGMASLVEIFEGKNVLKDDVADIYTDDLLEYEEWVFWDVFAHKLADREMARRIKKDGVTKANMREMFDLHSALEAKYEKEFERHGLDRVEIVEDRYKEPKIRKDQNGSFIKN